MPKRAETFGGFDNPEKDAHLCFRKKLYQLRESSSARCENSPDLKQEVENGNLTDTPFPTHGLEVRCSSGSSFNKPCHSFNSLNTDKKQRRSLTATPTPSIQSFIALQAFQSLLSSSRNTSILPPSSSSSSVFSSLPFYDPSDIYRLTTTPLLMTQGKEQLIQIAELQNQVNILMVCN